MSEIVKEMCTIVENGAGIVDTMTCILSEGTNAEKCEDAIAYLENEGICLASNDNVVCDVVRSFHTMENFGDDVETIIELAAKFESGEGTAGLEAFAETFKLACDSGEVLKDGSVAATAAVDDVGEGVDDVGQDVDTLGETLGL